MQGVLSFSGSWHDPVPSLRRAVFLFLAITVAETVAIGLQQVKTSVPPVYLMGALRALDLGILMIWGPWTFSKKSFQISVKRSLFVSLLLGAAGVGTLVLGKCLFDFSLLPAMKMGSFPTTFSLTAFLITSCFLGPVTEELVFRGLIYRLARERWNAWACTVCISIFFALLHQSYFFPFCGSVIFCLVYEWNKTLLSPVLVHITGNLIIYLLPLWLS